MNSYLVDETFFSCAGEGPHIGSPSFFIRFSGCNLTCDFCDTQKQSSNLFNLDYLMAHINKKCPDYFFGDVVITGGEPFLQIDKSIVHELIKRFSFVRIETNGDSSIVRCDEDIIRINDVLDYCPEITISPKTTDLNIDILKHASTIKLMYPLLFDEREIDWMLSYLGEENRIYSMGLIVQPIVYDNEDKNDFYNRCREALNFCLTRTSRDRNNWRVIPQAHKFMGLK